MSTGQLFNINLQQLIVAVKEDTRLELDFLQGDEEELIVHLIPKITEINDHTFTVDCKPSRYTCRCIIVADVVSTKCSIIGSCSWFELNTVCLALSNSVVTHISCHTVCNGNYAHCLSSSVLYRLVLLCIFPISAQVSCRYHLQNGTLVIIIGKQQLSQTKVW